MATVGIAKENVSRRRNLQLTRHDPVSQPVVLKAKEPSPNAPKLVYFYDC